MPESFFMCKGNMLHESTVLKQKVSRTKLISDDRVDNLSDPVKLDTALI